MRLAQILVIRTLFTAWCARATQARGEWSMLHPKNVKRIRVFLIAYAREKHVRIHEFANVGNHLHLLVQAQTKDHMKAFLRHTTGRIAQMVTGAKKGEALKTRFWDHLVWSCIVSFGRNFAETSRYVLKNVLEAYGPDLDLKKWRGDLRAAQFF